MKSPRLKPFRLILLFAFIYSSANAGLKLDFDRTNQTYDWLTTIDYKVNRQGFESLLSFNGDSNLIRGKSNRWQENAKARFNAEKSMITQLSLITSAEYAVNGLDKRRVRTSELAVGLSIHPVRFLDIKPLLKVDRIKRSDSDSHRNDQGAGYGIESNFSPSSIYGFNMSAALSFDRTQLSNIPSDMGSGSFNAIKGFNRGDSITVALKGMESSKKYYGSSGKTESIVKQIKQEREGAMAVAINLPASLKLRANADAHLSRYLYRYSIIDEATSPQRDNFGRGNGYKLGLESRGGYTSTALITYSWSKSKQDYQGVELDQNTEVGELSFQGKVRLSERDSVSTDIFFGVTSYSNPNIGLYRQDRDQKAIIVNGRGSHTFSRFFKAGVTGGASSFHQIYISGAQSANNGRNDTYILTPFAEWKLSKSLNIIQSVEIQANYITFDFDRKKLATRNRIFRRATSRTDFRFTFSPELAWEQAIIYRYEDYGQLIWDEGWQQAMSWDRRKSGLETKFIYSPVNSFRIAPFFGWEKTNDYTHSVDSNSDSAELNEIRKLTDEQVKLMLAVETVFNWSQSRHLRAEFSRRIRKFMERPREFTDYAAVSMEFIF